MEWYALLLLLVVVDDVDELLVPLERVKGDEEVDEELDEGAGDAALLFPLFDLADL